MAYTCEEAGTSIVPRLHELLPKVHQELFEGGKALTALTGLAPWKWGTEQDAAFTELKRRHGGGRDPCHPER